MNVALCAEGLRGVQLVFGQVLSDWTGDNTGSDIAQGTLSLPRETLGVRSLILGLDRAKVVFVGLGEYVNDQETPTVLSYLRTPEQPAPCLWKPQAPQYEGSTTSPLLPTQATHGFEPLLNIDLGGQRASKIASFTSLTVYFVAPPSSGGRQTIQFPGHQRIVRLTAIRTRDERLVEIQFEVECCSGEGSTGTDVLKLVAPSIPFPAVADTSSSVRTRSAWGTEAAPGPAPADAQQEWSHEEIYESPSQGSRLVGMYVGCRDFSHVGGVYETASG
ncbi:hypothetical protein BDV19DRAFT_393480 [Aspergillus venezuelensis]